MMKSIHDKQTECLLIISNSHAGNVAVGTCYTVCNVGAVACFAIGGVIFGVCKLLSRVFYVVSYHYFILILSNLRCCNAFSNKRMCPSPRRLLEKLRFNFWSSLILKLSKTYVDCVKKKLCKDGNICVSLARIFV